MAFDPSYCVCRLGMSLPIGKAPQLTALYRLGRMVSRTRAYSHRTHLAPRVRGRRLTTIGRHVYANSYSLEHGDGSRSDVAGMPV